MPGFDLQPTLTGGLVHLLPLRPEDFDSLYAVASDPLIWEQHPQHDRYKPDVFRGFFDSGIDCGGALITLDAMDGRVIGSSRFYGYNPAEREIEIGWTFLARSHWGGPWNGEMKRLMLDHAFRWVDTVVFKISAQNWRSRRAVEKIGAVLQPDRSDAVTCVYAITRAAMR